MKARDQGIPTKQVANLFHVSCSWVRRIMQRRRELGETAPRPQGGATVIKIDMQRLQELVEQNPDATISELHQQLGIQCCESAVGEALGRLNLTFKKRQSMRLNKTGPMSQKNANGGKNRHRNGMLAG